MKEDLIAILGPLSAIVSFVLGRRWERYRRAQDTRADLLDPIQNWIRGVEKFIGILGDTLCSIMLHSAKPMTYDFNERRISAQFMVEHTNEVLGILESRALSTRKTKPCTDRLADIVRVLDNQVKCTVLPLENEILEQATTGDLSETFLRHVGEIKLSLESQVQEAYSLITKIRVDLN